MPFHLHKSDNGEFYMNYRAKNGREVWRTSETYKRKAGAVKATYSLAKAFGTTWDGCYWDHAFWKNNNDPFYFTPPPAQY